MAVRMPVRRSMLLAVLMVAVGLAGTGAQAVKPADVVARVRQQVAPDTRIAVFDVKADATPQGIELTGDIESVAARDALTRAFKDAGFAAVVDRTSLLPDPEMAAKPLGLVTVSVAVMKTKASHSSELGNQLIMGMAVRALKKSGDWYYVQSLDDRYLGWMEASHLALMTKERAEAALSAPRTIVTSTFALLRESAAADAAPVADLVAGNLLQSMTTVPAPAGWAAVQLPDGRHGFVALADASDYRAWKASRALTPENIERTARRFMGVPYLWGGTSVKGFDCSGFVKTVFRLNGLELQRDTDQQSNEGTAVSLEGDLAQVKKGDVLFFGPRPGAANITHTGIYLGGKLFIHCAGLVKVNSFDPSSPLYSENLLKRLLKARRFGTSVTP